MSSARIETYREFWPFYLREHSNRTSRGLHYAGTSLAIASLISALATENYWYLLLMVVGAYGLAWLGHFVFERNRPATFQYPFWSLFSDFRLYLLWLTGRLGPELVKAGVKVGS
jgi:hypothetical protein